MAQQEKEKLDFGKFLNKFGFKWDTEDEVWFDVKDNHYSDYEILKAFNEWYNKKT